MKTTKKIAMFVLSGAMALSSVFMLSGCGKGKVPNALEKLIGKIDSGEDIIKLAEDIISGDGILSILDGITLDLNGKTIDVKSFLMQSDDDGEYTIKNGKIKSDEDIKLLMKNATVNLEDVELVVGDNSEVIAQTSPNTLNISGDTSIENKSGETATLVLEEGTRVVVAKEVEAPTNIEIVGKDVKVENNSSAEGNTISIAQNVEGDIKIINKGNLESVENDSQNAEINLKTTGDQETPVEITGSNPDAVREFYFNIVTAYSGDHILACDLADDTAINLSYFANLTYMNHHDFVGWFTNDGTNGDWGTEITEGTVITDSINMYAKFQVEKYTATFIVENEIIEKEIDYNTNVSAPLKSEYTLTEGYYITGWTNDAVQTHLESVTFPFVVTQDVTFRAQVSNEYTLNIHKNDGSEEIISQVYAYGTELDSIDYPFNPPVGKQLGGYYTTANCTQEITFPYVVNENADIYAKWIDESQEPIVNFYTNYGQGHDGFFIYPQVQDGIAYLDNTIVGEGSRFRKFGYVMKGWSTDAAGTNVVAGFDTNCEWTESTYELPSGTSNLYAQFAKLPLITFNSSDGVFADGTTTFVGQDDIDFPEFPTAPIMAGKSFAGWYTEPNGNGEEYRPVQIIITDGDEYRIIDANIIIPTATTYYAHYVDEIAYTIHANPYGEDLGLTFTNGESTKKVPLNKEYIRCLVLGQEDYEDSLFANAPFITTEDCLPALAQLNVAGKIATRYKNADASLTLAVNSIRYNEELQSSIDWYPSFVTANDRYTFDANGGHYVWAGEEIEKMYSYWHATSEYSESLAPILNLDFINISDGYPDYIYGFYSSPQRQGYNFKGWYTQNGTENGEWGTHVYQSYNFQTAGSTFYAKWEEAVEDDVTESINFTFDANGGKIACGSPYIPQDNISTDTSEFYIAIEDFFEPYRILALLQKSGQYFLGWYTENGTDSNYGDEIVFDWDLFCMKIAGTEDYIETDLVMYARWGTYEESVAKFGNTEDFMNY